MANRAILTELVMNSFPLRFDLLKPLLVTIYFTGNVNMIILVDTSRRDKTGDMNSIHQHSEPYYPTGAATPPRIQFALNSTMYNVTQV